MKMEQATTLYEYQNGNCFVTILEDGTKIREWEGEAQPIFPESLDVKLTNKCDAGCKFCHENSVPNGLHGDLNIDLFDSLPPGVEICVGGGSPTSHPDLIPFLTRLKNNKLIPNLTVNSRHIKPYWDLLQQLRNEKLIYGLGISYFEPHEQDIVDIIDDNTIVHFIIGVHTLDNIRSLYTRANRPLLKILLLGYKEYGRGIKFYDEQVEDRKQQWKDDLVILFKEFPKMLVCFDNLAVTQLNVRRLLTKDAWDKFYMGDDGKHTMYIDLVKKQYAQSSRDSTRYDLNCSIDEAFKTIRDNV